MEASLEVSEMVNQKNKEQEHWRGKRSGSYLGVIDPTAQLLKIFCKLRHLITARVYPAQQKKQASLSISSEARATTQRGCTITK